MHRWIFNQKQLYKNKEDRLHRFLKDKCQQQKESSHSLYMQEFVFVRVIRSNYYALTRLYYYIKKEELVVIKTLLPGNKYLIEREIENYRNMDHPFIPRYYGTIEGESNKSFVIEFINGHPLSDISKMKMKMKDEEKLIIIFDLLCIFSYLKLKKYIYRD